MDGPDSSIIHWALGAMVPAGGAFFMFLLKRAFSDFEANISRLFKGLEERMKQAQEHDTKLQLLDQRVTQLEAKKRR